MIVLINYHRESQGDGGLNQSLDFVTLARLVIVEIFSLEY